MATVVDKSEPLSCPFCDGTARLESVLRDGYAEIPNDPNAKAYYYTCNSCASVGGWGKSGTSALKLWNMRTTK